MKRRACVQCLRTYTPRKINQRYCGPRCRWAYWKKMREDGYQSTPRVSAATLNGGPKADLDFDVTKLGIEKAIAVYERRAEVLREALAAMTAAR